MASYILLERLKVEDANCIAGITYGFPAVTHFLGFTHALSRKFDAKFGMTLTGCAIFCHDHHVHKNEQFDVRFIQSKRPPVTLHGAKYKQNANKTAPIIEEGKMDMTVSILLRCNDEVSGKDEIQELYLESFKQWIYHSRLAGGAIHDVNNISFFGEDIKIEKLKRKVLPSYVLLDASHELEQYVTTSKSLEPERELCDLWTDFFAFKMKARLDPNDASDIEWVRQAKPKAQGWFVPLMIGYKGVSPLYEASEVENLRDSRYPFRFVESVHSIGEWKSSHRVKNIEDLIWSYHIESEWYLCKQDHVELNSARIDEALLESSFENDLINSF